MRSGAWEKCSKGLEGRSIYCLAQSATGEIFAGASRGDFFWSNDQGNTWESVKLVDPNDHWRTREAENIISVAVGEDGKIFAGTDRGALFCVMRNGSSWSPALVALYGGRISSVVTNRIGHVFICADDTCILRSTDSGHSWETLDEGIKGLHPTSLAIDSAGILSAGTSEKGVFRSIDNGDTWMGAAKGLSDLKIKSLTIGSRNGLLALTNTGHMFHSTDGGNAWFSALRRGGNRPVRVLAVSQHFVYAFLGGGQFIRSDDDGRHWIDISAGNLGNIEPTSLLATREGVLLMGVHSLGIYRSTDGAQYWRLSNTGLVFPYVISLEWNANLILAGTQGGGIYCSSNNGTSWTHASPESGNILSVKLDSKGFMYAIVDEYGRQQFYRSDDKGKTWTVFQSGLPKGVSLSTMAIDHRGCLFLGSNGSGIYISDSRGETWQERNGGLYEKRITAIVPSRTGFVYASTRRGVFRSSNQGKMWELIYNRDIPVIAIFEQKRGKLLVGTNGDGIYLLSGNGLYWQKVDFPSLTVTSFMDDTHGTIYATTYTGEIFSSRDEGRAWRRTNSGLPSEHTTVLMRIANGRILAGTLGEGIFRSLQKKAR